MCSEVWEPQLLGAYPVPPGLCRESAPENPSLPVTEELEETSPG